MTSRVKATSQSKSSQATKSSQSRSKTTSTDESPKSKQDSQTPANVREETHVVPEPEKREPTKAEREFIDNEPSYSAEQLDQMSEYYGTAKTDTQGEVAEIRTTGLAGQEQAEKS